MRVKLKPKYKGIARLGTLLRITRSGQWLILRDGRVRAERFWAWMWEVIDGKKAENNIEL